MEAGFPLYGHEMGVDPDGQRMPIFAVPLAKFAVSFAPQKGDFIAARRWSGSLTPSGAS